MTKEEIFNTLKGIVKPYVKNQEAFENLSQRTDFLADLKINSANLVDIILDVEESFGITIDNNSMQKMLSVESTVEIIESKLAAL